MASSRRFSVLALIVAYPLRSGCSFAGFASTGAGGGAGEEDMTRAAGEWTGGRAARSATTSATRRPI